METSGRSPMDRRTLILSGLASLGAPGLALAQASQAQVKPLPPAAPAAPASSYSPSAGSPPPPSPSIASQPSYPAAAPAQTYSRDEIVNQVSDFMGVTAETAGAI